MKLDTSALVRTARIASGLTQDMFCKKLEKTQTTISKYERNVHTPPDYVIIRCIRFLKNDQASEISMDEDIFQLMKKIERFEGKKMAKKRAALHVIIDALLDD